MADSEIAVWQLPGKETMSDDDKIFIVSGTSEFLIKKSDFVKFVNGLSSGERSKLYSIIIDGTGQKILADNGQYLSISELLSTEQFSVNSAGITEIKGYHIHDNKNILDKFSEDEKNGILYNGEPIGAYELPIANETTLGGVKPDNITVTVTPEGVISAVQDGAGIAEWTPLNKYEENDLILNDNIIYRCSEGHTSGNSFDSSEQSKWVAILGAKGDKGDRGEKGERGEPGADGAAGKDGINGENGKDGFSPSVEISDADNGYTLTVTNKDEDTKSVTITNGRDGLDGKNGVDGKDGRIEIITNNTFTAVTLPAESWEGKEVPYTQSVRIEGLSGDIEAIIDVVISEDVTTGISEINAYQNITRAVSGENSITFYCYQNKPDVDLNITVGYLQIRGDV